MIPCLQFYFPLCSSLPSLPRNTNGISSILGRGSILGCNDTCSCPSTYSWPGSYQLQARANTSRTTKSSRWWCISLAAPLTGFGLIPFFFFFPVFSSSSFLVPLLQPAITFAAIHSRFCLIFSLPLPGRLVCHRLGVLICSREGGELQASIRRNPTAFSGYCSLTEWHADYLSTASLCCELLWKS